jgi:D-alanyl-D-alanine carboxypeptidase/D-alanyl-D-alanine-endopeptidase (penicillin-binding protein 4)
MSATARRVTAALLVLGALVALFVAFSGGDSNAGSSTTTGATTPMWSVRRVPEPIVDAVGAQRLQAVLDRAAPGAGTCFVVDSGTHTIAAHNHDAPLIGASTQKVLVAAAALSILGPDFTYQTKVVAPAAPADGVVDRIWLVGAGDPVLTTGEYASFLQSQGKTKGDATTSLEALADAVVAKGVHRIPGGVVGDDSRYDGVRYLPTWKDTYRTDGEVGPLGALTVNDGYSMWSPNRKVPVDDPARNTATRFTELLRSRGVEVGSADVGTAPAGAAELAQVASPNLRSIVASMLASSDNLTAELLTKELGVHTAKVGSTAAGVAATTAKLHELGVPIAAGSLKDGSGLDRGNQVTCNELVATLALADRPELVTLFDGLPVAGQNGTLFDQFLGTKLVGNFRGKTGSLDGVSGLTGVLDLGRRLRFAFLDNGAFTDAQAGAIRVRIGEIVGTFPDAPPVDALVPAPQ